MISLLILAAVVLVAIIAWPKAGEVPSGPTVEFRRGDDSIAKFSVELAITQEQQTRGLMYREHLPDGSGMLFIYAPARNVGMWMPNMLISLDFLFMDERGVVVRIAEDIPPCPSVDDCPTIWAGSPVKYVLEVPAGTIERYDLRLGDVMRTSID